MNTVIRYAANNTRRPAGPWLRLFRALFVLGVWVLVGLAGLVAWAQLAA